MLNEKLIYNYIYSFFLEKISKGLLLSDLQFVRFQPLLGHYVSKRMQHLAPDRKQPHNGSTGSHALERQFVVAAIE